MKKFITENIDILLDQFIKKLAAVFSFLGVGIALEFYPNSLWIIFWFGVFGYFFGMAFGAHWLAEKNNDKKN